MSVSANAVTDEPAFSQDFFDWFAQSRAVDALGQPLLLYRGQHGQGVGDRIHTRLPSITFCEERIAAVYARAPNDHRESADEPRILRGYLKIERPVVVNPDDPFVDFSDLIEALGFDKAATIARELSSRVEDTGAWHDGELGEDFTGVEDLLRVAPDRLVECYVDAYHIFDCPKYVQWFRQAGFDGAIHCGNGESASEVEYKVFSAGQVMLVSDGDLKIALPAKGGSREHSPSPCP